MTEQCRTGAEMRVSSPKARAMSSILDSKDGIVLGNEWHVNICISVVSGVITDIIITIYGAVLYL